MVYEHVHLGYGKDTGFTTQLVQDTYFMIDKEECNREDVVSPLASPERYHDMDLSDGVS